MPPRANPSITLMINQAQQKLRELKELQFFGGDSLNLKRFAQPATVPADFSPHCWRVVMTPADPATTMPFKATIKPTAQTPYAGGQVESVRRDDGAFEYLFILNGGLDTLVYFVMEIEYSGAATFSVTQLG